MVKKGEGETMTLELKGEFNTRRKEEIPKQKEPCI